MNSAEDFNIKNVNNILNKLQLTTILLELGNLQLITLLTCNYQW